MADYIFFHVVSAKTKREAKKRFKELVEHVCIEEGNAIEHVMQCDSIKIDENGEDYVDMEVPS